MSRLNKQRLWELNLEAYLLDVVEALKIVSRRAETGYRSPDYQALSIQGEKLLEEARYLRTMEDEV